MKRETKIIIVVCVFIFVLAVWFILLIMNPEPHFRITKEGVEIDEIEIYKSCSSENWNDPDYPVGICFQLYTKKISREDLTLEWLEENCLKDKSYNKYGCEGYLVETWNQIK